MLTFVPNTSLPEVKLKWNRFIYTKQKGADYFKNVSR